MCDTPDAVPPFQIFVKSTRRYVYNDFPHNRYIWICQNTIYPN